MLRNAAADDSLLVFVLAMVLIISAAAIALIKFADAVDEYRNTDRRKTAPGRVEARFDD